MGRTGGPGEGAGESARSGGSDAGGDRASGLESLEGRILAIERLVGVDPGRALERAEGLVQEFPDELAPYMLGVVVALVGGKSQRALRLIRRMHRRFEPCREDHALEALALLQDRKVVAAQKALRKAGARSVRDLIAILPYGGGLIRGVVTRIEAQSKQSTASRSSPGGRRHPRGAARSKPARPRSAPEPGPPRPPPAPPDTPRAPTLATPSPEIRVQLRLPSADRIAALLDAPREESPDWFRLRTELAELSLFEGFDELLCLSTLRGVDRYWYQIETARKVLKQFKGRALLADEVGLGKTIEAGMILSEYSLRGMAERVLVLAPPSLVGQWRDELAEKFGLDFATTSDAAFRGDPSAFWRGPRVVASLAVARRRETAMRLASEAPFDLVIVDEAHRLKNRSTLSYKLVHGLRTRFLLLLSATPVQNSLVELYNLLTLLEPGIFQTEREFRSAYMVKGSPRTPRNRDALRGLMRRVMIRNTRALVDVRLPPRQALTLGVEPGEEEARCYRELSDFITRAHRQGDGSSFGLRQLLRAAGSSPQAAARALERRAQTPELAALAESYRKLESGAKERALLDLLAKNPDEKKLVFVGQLATLEHLEKLLAARGVPCARFDGSLSPAEKDAAIEAFRERVPVLLSSESGGEGRNLQFCNTVIHFDLPWNPMAIEQRIGRVHRIGQTREVFVFNLVTRRTVEDALLGILNEKLNLFELVVGEVDAILGELDQEVDFAELVFRAWAEASANAREQALDLLGEELRTARGRYESTRELDEALFADELEVGGG